MYYIITNSLEHHGVPGQKWGVRNGPPYPLSRSSGKSKTVYGSSYQNSHQTSKSTKYPSNKSDEAQKAIRNAENGIERGEWFRKPRTITKGTPIYRVETSNKGNIRDGSTYVSYLDVDRNMYKGPNRHWIKENQGGNGKTQIYENEYSLKEDLNIPSRKEVRDIQRKILEKNDTYKAAVGMAYLEKFTEWDTSDFSEQTQKAINYDLWSNKASELIRDKKYQKNFVDSLKKTENSYLSESVDWVMNLSEEYRNEVISELKKKGYNAMADEASIGMSDSRQGIDTLIIFNAKDTMDLKNSTKINEESGLFKKKNTTDKEALEWLDKAHLEENKKKKW